MKLLKYIEDKVLPSSKKVAKRTAVRAIVTDKKGLIPILYVSTCTYHKLPGGGVENGEDRYTALRREMKEETGCQTKIHGELGKVVEYRSKFDLYQVSYFFYGKVSAKGKVELTEEEKEEGFVLEWYDIDDAIETFKNDNTQDYEGKFILKRDLVALKEFKRIQNELGA